MKPITIKDVARRAGVSPKTVSRVINGEAHVRAEVREVVTRVVAEMNYRPNAFARGLSSSRSFLIGLFFDDPASSYAASIQRGALERARELGRHLIIEPVSFDRPDWRAVLDESLAGLHLDGAILTSPICDRDGFDDAEIARMSWPQLTTIRQPNYEMGAAAVELLLRGRSPAGAEDDEAGRDLAYELLRRDSSGAKPG